VPNAVTVAEGIERRLVCWCVDVYTYIQRFLACVKVMTMLVWGCGHCDFGEPPCVEESHIAAWDGARGRM